MISIDEVNALDRARFIERFGGVYEHSRWVAEQAETRRPFADVDALAVAMQRCVEAASRETRLALIRAHPELLGRPASMEPLTAESRSEQFSAGLDRCTQEELARLKPLNASYRDKFGFPFVVAVRGMTRTEIIARMALRLTNSAEDEFHNSLVEIIKIARSRLSSLVD